jgi:tetraacyldisaccharide 4'-kinase
MLPTGNLREARSNARRADVIAVTKCPDHISREDKVKITNEIGRFSSKGTPVFFSKIKYLEPKAVFKKTEGISSNIFLVTGIANVGGIVNYVRDNYNLLGHEAFPDHFTFSKKSVRDRILKLFDEMDVERKCILTTEKDMVRLLSLSEDDLDLEQYPFFYLPIKTEFLAGDESFDSYILTKIETLIRK